MKDSDRRTDGSGPPSSRGPVFLNSYQIAYLTTVRCSIAMLARWVLAAIGTAFLLFAAGSALPSFPADATEMDIVYDEDADGITIATENATIDISKLQPSGMIRAADDSSGNGYGFTVSSFIGYNVSETAENPFADWAYQASLEGVSWEVVGPSKTTSEKGSTVTVALRAVVDMTKRLPGSTTGTGTTAQPGVEIIHEWAEVQFTFQVSTDNRVAAYPGFSDHQIDVNGSTEMKFDMVLRLNKMIYVNRLAVEMNLCVMEAGSMVIAPSDEPYRFYGYQSSGVTTSDPAVNETNGTSPIVHKFQYRQTEEQMFAFVEDGVPMGYFAWANKIMLNWSAGNSSLADSTAHYGTDGECLRLYLSSPIDRDVAAISLDPSLGIFASAATGGGDGGVIRPPEDGGIFGSSVMSVAAGILVGGAVIGSGVSALYISRRGKDDPAETVTLENNRYYKGGRD